MYLLLSSYSPFSDNGVLPLNNSPFPIACKKIESTPITSPRCLWVVRSYNANLSQLIHPGPSSSQSSFFMELSQLYAVTLTHYSTEPLITGPDYDPLLLLLALAGDVHPNPGRSRYPCLVCFKNVIRQGTS